MRRRFIKWGSNVTATSFLLLAILIVVNYISSRNYARFDLTEAEQYTLSERTIDILKNLDDEVKVIAFVKDAPELRNRAKRLMEQYRYHSRKFLFEFADPDKNPAMAEEYRVNRYDTYVVIGGAGEGEGMERRESIHPFFNEETLTNGIIKVTSKREKVIYFSKGHGEKSIEDRNSKGYERLSEALKSENFRVAPIVLAGVEGIPVDADLIVIAGPQKELLDLELEMLGNYLEEGGRLLFMIDPFTVQKSARFTEKYGVHLANDIIIDKMGKMIGGDYLIPTVASYDLSHEVTEGFDLMTIFPLARSVQRSGEVDGTKGTKLAFTLPDAWGETDRDRLEGGAVSLDKDMDNVGPVAIALVVEVELESEKNAHADGESHDHEHTDEVGAMIVVGDSDFVGNSYIGVGGNLDLFMNMTNWLAGDKEMISIRPKTPDMVPVLFSNTQLGLIAGVGIVGFPLAILIPGIWINIIRRRS